MDSQRGGWGSYVRLESNEAIVSRLAQQDKIPWYNKPNLRLLYLLMFPTCFAVEMTSGFDASMVNGLQAVPSWLEYFHHPHSASLGFISSMYSLGCVAAVPFAPVVVDKIGRRYPVLIGGVISIIGSILQGFALDFTMFIIARFILGFANSFCIVAASSLIGELSHPKERAILCGLFTTFYHLGAVTAAGSTLGTFSMASNWGWRIPSLLQGMPSLLQVFFIWFIPESPRWLISRGRREEAYAILAKWHAEGDENSEFVKAEYAQIEQMLDAGQRIAQMKRNDVFSAAGMRRRVIVTAFLGLFTNWSGSILASHYLSPVLEDIGIHDNKTKNIINFARVTWDFVNCAISALMVPRYPRRRMFLACTVSLFVVFVAWTIATAEHSLTHNEVFAHMVLICIFAFAPAYNLGSPLLYTVVVELFPFHVRARGVALLQFWNRGAAFFIEFVNPIGFEAAGWRWYITYCIWDAFQVIFVYFMFPETSGRTLEELTFLYEEDREAFRPNHFETLRGGGEFGTYAYGTMRGHPTRTFGIERG